MDTNEEELSKLRSQENIELVEHFDKIVQIIQTKCKRCKAYSCLGCSLSFGEIGYRLKECARLLDIDCSQLNKQYPAHDHHDL